MLRFVHLSDIHFGVYAPGWDENEDQRAQLVVDLGELVREDRTAVDGILIGGDVAFSGQKQQYEDAREWLEAVRKASGCPDGAVWVIPGNHDIDWSVADAPIGAEFRRTVRGCSLDGLDALLDERLARDQAGAALIEPLKEYNEFAERWGCACTAYEPFWRDRPLQLGGVPVLLWGLNSALVSDKHDARSENDEPNLVLGSHQCKVEERPGEIRIVICHHPPSYLRDWERVAAYLARAHIILFGHEHSYNCQQAEPRGPVHVHAGAVAPDEGESWVPTYNLLTLELDGDDVKLEVRPRVWSRGAKCFVAHGDDREDFAIGRDRRRLGAVEELPPEPVSADEASDEALPAPATPLAPDQSVAAAEEPPVEDHLRLRQIAVAYFSAPQTQRLHIAEKLGVLRDEDLELPNDRERYAAVLRRIRDDGLIDQLAEELGL